VDQLEISILQIELFKNNSKEKYIFQGVKDLQIHLINKEYLGFLSYMING
jgi:hypothetical protein